MSYKIVVARYNEDITWSTQFDNVIIINKGIQLSISNEIFMPNVGREGHTYYQYIYDNYEKLPEYLIFLQGNPFDHSPNIIELLNHFIHKISSKTTLTMTYLSQQFHSVNPCKTDRWLPDLEIRDVYEKLFGSIIDIDSLFGGGAQFIVSRELILRRSKDFYKNIIDLLGYHIDPIEGHVIERLHPYVFGVIIR